MSHCEKHVSGTRRTDALSVVPVRKLATVTALLCVAAQLLSRMSGAIADTNEGPAGVVMGQALWNAAQVGLLLLLLSVWQLSRRGWVIALAVTALACLPFAIYAISPGGWALTALLLATCGLIYARGTGDLSIAIVDAPARGTPAFYKFELLAFVCTLLCSMYNFNASKNVFPHWFSIFDRVGLAAGFTPDQAAIARGMYTLGINGVVKPAFIKVGSATCNLGALVFALIWAVLPFLYVLYFAVLAKLARYSPGAKLQQALCLFCIFHFLFLTDLVDYRFGRGIENNAAEWAHWAERFAWRIAILLPIYQKITTGHWLRGNGIVGVALHYAVALWAIGFLIGYVLLKDVPYFFRFATGLHVPKLRFLDLEVLGYHAALVLMTLVYGFSFLAFRCKRISTFSIGRR